MNHSECFQLLELNPVCIVSTSQPTPESVTTLWDKLRKDYDEIVHIPMSSGLSSSMQTARMLAAHFHDMDSLAAADTQRLLELPDVGPEVAIAIRSFFESPAYQHMLA